MTVKEVYEQAKPLSEEDRLKLATWIFSDLGIDGPVDYKDYWTDEDWEDLTADAMRRWDADEERGNDAQTKRRLGQATEFA